MTQNTTSPQVVENSTQRLPELRQVIPLADVLEFPDRLEILVELPGVAPDSVDVRHEGRELLVLAERRIEDARLVHGEFGSVRFARTFALPEDVSGEVRADMADGLLTLALPKAEERRARRIEVKRS